MEDPVSVSSEDLFPPIDDRLMELIYFGDPGYFFWSKSGGMYHIWHTSRPETAHYGPTSLKFQIDCPLEYKLATYQFVYQRWYFNFMKKEEWSTFEQSFLTSIPGHGYMPQAHIVQGLMHGNKVLREGKSREEAVEMQQMVEQLVKSGHIPLQPGISIYDLPIQQDDLCEEVRREDGPQGRAEGIMINPGTAMRTKYQH